MTLDNALRDFLPTFISMDIEGAEVPALKGAKKRSENICRTLEFVFIITLSKSLSYKHNQSMQSGYEFFVRNYTGYLTETVVYAIHRRTKTEPSKDTKIDLFDNKDTIILVGLGHLFVENFHNITMALGRDPNFLLTTMRKMGPKIFWIKVPQKMNFYPYQKTPN